MAVLAVLTGFDQAAKVVLAFSTAKGGAQDEEKRNKIKIRGRERWCG